MPPKYFVPELASPLKRLKYRLIDHRRPLPKAPDRVQIQTVSGCNANCVFCPNKKTEIEIPMGKRMDWGLYRSIVQQATEAGVRRISPYLMNEPLLDTEMPERVKVITENKRFPNQFSRINSHGAMCNERMAKGLLDAGLDQIHFSVQGIDPAIYEKIMGLKLEVVVRNIERMLEFKHQGNYHTEIDVIMLETVEVIPQKKKVKKFWRKRGIDAVRFNKLENRGHHDKIQSDAIAVRDLEPFDWCKRMFDQMYILFDGRAVQCCADWEQSSVMGDLSKNRLVDVWMNPRYKDYRRRFLDGEVKGMLCDGCTKDKGDDDYDGD